MFDRLAELREKRENGEGGFTLIELLVVVVIIGILIAIAIPLYLNYRKSANDKAAQSDVRGAISALETCYTDNNSSYPTAVASGGGAPTGCTSQNIKTSSNTSLRYVPSATTGTVSSYTIYSTNSGGSGKIYCYNSTNGGSVKDATGTDMSTATC